MKLRLDGLGDRRRRRRRGRVRRGGRRRPRGRSRPAAGADHRRPGGDRGAPWQGGAAAERPLSDAATPPPARPWPGSRHEHACPLVLGRAGGELDGLARARRQRARRRGRRPRPRPRHRRPRRRPAPPSRSSAASPSRRAPGRWAFPIFAESAPRAAARRARARHAGDRQVRRHRRDRPASTRRCLRPAHPAAEHLHRPQKPIQVEPKLYAIGAAGPDSPLLMTTNFSLTYFSVSGEVEGAVCPPGCWSPTATASRCSPGWAAGKFDAEKIAKTVKDSGIAENA